MSGQTHIPTDAVALHLRAQKRLLADPRGVWGPGAGETAVARAVKGPNGD